MSGEILVAILSAIAGTIASRAYGVKGVPGGVAQTVYRKDTVAEATRIFREWSRQSDFQQLAPAEPPYQSQIADEFSLRCGILRASPLCRGLLRYGNYLIDLRFINSTGQAQLEKTLQAVDAMMSERLGLRRPAQMNREELFTREFDRTCGTATRMKMESRASPGKAKPRFGLLFTEKLLLECRACSAL